MTDTPETPNPGSAEALDQGCLCPPAARKALSDEAGVKRAAGRLLDGREHNTMPGAWEKPL